MILLLLPFLPPSPVSKLDGQHTGRLRKRDNLLTGGGGEEQNHTTAKKPGTLLNIEYSLLKINFIVIQ
jgi:hypothetical protein